MKRINIGIDFDNTIVDYSNLFGKIAFEKKIIKKNISYSKKNIRDYFVDQNKEDLWTKLQGEVYGKYINRAKPYKNFKKIINSLSEDKYEKFIISHKTKFPYLGRKYNLHKSATNWLSNNNFFKNNYFKKKNVYFNQSLKKKISVITKLKCKYFIDDSLYVLEMLPNNITKILFDPDKNYKKNKKYLKLSDWKDLIDIL